MDHVEAFLKLIDNAKKAAQDLISSNTIPLYNARYNAIARYLDSIYKATIEGKLYKKFVYLEIVKMLNDNDPRDLEDAILAVNKHYCEFFREID